jgi:hypothetical protein
VGYVVFESDPDAGLAVVEAAVADAGIAHGALTMLADYAASRSLPGVMLRLPAAHPLVRVALERGGALTVRAYPADGQAPVPLAGVVDLAALLGQLIGALERRLAASRYAGWSGVIQFENDGSRTALVFEQGHGHVAELAQAPDLLITVSALGALVQLVLGYRSAADLRTTGGLSCETTAFGLLDALFPLV